MQKSFYISLIYSVTLESEVERFFAYTFQVLKDTCLGFLPPILCITGGWKFVYGDHGIE